MYNYTPIHVFYMCTCMPLVILSHGAGGDNMCVLPVPSIAAAAKRDKSCYLPPKSLEEVFCSQKTAKEKGTHTHTHTHTHTSHCHNHLTFCMKTHYALHVLHLFSGHSGNAEVAFSSNLHSDLVEDPQTDAATTSSLP